MGMQGSMGMQGLRFAHVAFRVADIQRTLRWYDEVFGAKLVYHAEAVGPKPEYYYAEFRHGQMIEFFTGGKPAPEPLPDATGFVHFSLLVDDIQAAIAHLQAVGATIVRPYFEGRAKQRIIYVGDPDGNVIELMEIPADSPIHRA